MRAASIEMGDEVTFSAFFDNRGHDTVPKASFRAELLVNGDRLFFDSTPGPVRQTTKSAYQSTPAGYWLNENIGMYDVGFRPTKPGTYHFKFILDRADDLHETNEMNNVVEGTFVVIASRN